MNIWYVQMFTILYLVIIIGENREIGSRLQFENDGSTHDHKDDSTISDEWNGGFFCKFPHPDLEWGYLY